MKNYNTDLWSVVLAVALVLTLAVILMTTKREKPAEVSFSAEEIELIVSADSTMRVLDARDSADLAVLRKISSELTDEDLDSGLYEKLCSLMIATVTSDDNDGVGIAAPQTGICKRLVAVQRFDKENHPFEIYPNNPIRITRAVKRWKKPWRDSRQSYSSMKRTILKAYCTPTKSSVMTCLTNNR